MECLTSCPAVAAAGDVEADVTMDDDDTVTAGDFAASKSAIFSFPVMTGFVSAPPAIIWARVDVIPAVLLPAEVAVTEGVAVTEMIGFWSTLVVMLDVAETVNEPQVKIFVECW